MSEIRDNKITIGLMVLLALFGLIGNMYDSRTNRLQTNTIVINAERIQVLENEIKMLQAQVIPQ